MNARPVLLAATAALALLSLAAQAKDAPKPAAAAATLPSYESLDSNGDGVVTLPEVTVRAPELAKRIAHCDADRDSKLSREEYAACKPVAPERPHGG
jgi:hypothetical protein